MRPDDPSRTAVRFDFQVPADIDVAEPPDGDIFNTGGEENVRLGSVRRALDSTSTWGTSAWRRCGGRTTSGGTLLFGSFPPRTRTRTLSISSKAFRTSSG
jgi:hypothetical protein